MAYWTNSDGLTVRLGDTEAVMAEASEVSTAGGQQRIIEINCLYGDNFPLDSEGSHTVNPANNVKIPSGAVIEWVEIIPYVDVDSSGDGLILDVGITDADGGSTLTDVDALVDAATQAEINAGGRNIAGWVGGSVAGTALSESAYITWETTVADATAGHFAIRVAYVMPGPSSDTLGT
jgi:hypothetical protein